MPLHAQQPIMRIETQSIHTIETTNPENLFGLWSVFSKCSAAMEDGKRYENMAWRLWARETFCVAPDNMFTPHWNLGRVSSSEEAVLPELSTSVASSDSSEGAFIATSSRSGSQNLISTTSSRPELRRNDSNQSRGREKHITPIDLEKVVNSIKTKQTIEPLSPLPPKLAPTTTLTLQQKTQSVEETTPRPSSPQAAAPRYIESSTSTVATALGSDMSPPVGSDVSTSTDLSQHSIVHGFEPGRISTSMRSSTNLNPTPILKNANHMRSEPVKAEPAKKKQPMFTLGGSSDEDNTSSFETSMYMAKRSSLSDSLKKPAQLRKTTSFKDEVTTRMIQEAISSEDSEAAIESESEEESDDNAIEDDDYDDDEDQWEDDDNENSGPSSVNEREMFQRVDSKPNLTSHRSLLTSMMHEGDRAQALQNAASRSSPAIRRSRTTTPNGPSTGSSPQEDSGLMMRAQATTRSKPIIMTTSNVHPPALSPRTTRRNMLQTELTQSLRQNLLWERQQKNATTNAVNKRNTAPTSNPASGLRRAMTTNDIKSMNPLPREAMARASAAYRDNTKNNNSFNDYFDQGLQEYHQKGW